MLLEIIKELLGLSNGKLRVFREDIKIGDEFVKCGTHPRSLWIKDDDTHDDSCRIKIVNIKRDLSVVEYIYIEIGGGRILRSSNYTMATSHLYTSYNKIDTPPGDD